MKEKIAALFRLGWTRYLGVGLLLAVLVGVWAVRTRGDGFSFEVIHPDGGTDPTAVTETADPVDVFEPVTRININTADQSLLETLPGIGPVKAKSILDYRRKAGGFKSAKELMNVSGIGEKTFAKIEPYVCVD